MTLESLVGGEIAQGWLVASRDGQWARVALPESKNANEIHDESRDRPFHVAGRFSDTELVRLVEFIRSSPRMPPIPGGPDGTSYGGFDEVRGHLPISSIERDRGRVVVALRGGAQDASGELVTLEFVNKQRQVRKTPPGWHRRL